MRFQVRSKTWLEADGKFVIGEGGLLLLEAIDRLGSIRRAARQLGWSYRHTWGYLKNMERNAGLRVVVTRHGGPTRGGTRLTPEGARLLRDYRRLQKALRASVRQQSRAMFSY